MPFVTNIVALSTFFFHIACLPLALLYFTPRSLRPHPKWTFRQAISMHLFGTLVAIISKLQPRIPLHLEDGKEKGRWITIPKRQPEDEAYFVGPLRENPSVTPGDVLGATWYPRILPPASEEPQGAGDAIVIFHIHGGAYVTGDGRTSDVGFLAKMLRGHTCATHVFAPQYRLSYLEASSASSGKTTEEGKVSRQGQTSRNPFPAALQDALTAYLYLIHDMGISPQNIILSGDSAGGHCAVGLLRYFAEYKDSFPRALPLPGAAMLWSPWIDPSNGEREAVEGNANYKTDYLPAKFVAWGSRAFTSSCSAPRQHSYINLSLGAFKTPVPLWVNAGAAELLFKDVGTWCDGMREVGNEVVFDVQEGAPHDILMVGAKLGFVVEAREMAERAGKWLEKIRGA